MAKHQKFEVEFEDGRTVEVTCDGRDWMFYEETSGESAVDLITNMRKVSTWYISSYAAMARQGLFEGTPEEFKEQVRFVMPLSDPTEQPDTPTAGSDNSASPSPSELE